MSDVLQVGYLFVGLIVGGLNARWLHRFLNDNIISTPVDGFDILMAGLLASLIAVIWPVVVGAWVVGKLVMLGVK